MLPCYVGFNCIDSSTFFSSSVVRYNNETPDSSATVFNNRGGDAEVVRGVRRSPGLAILK